jgi:hypothetical protein
MEEEEESMATAVQGPVRGSLQSVMEEARRVK